jgi:hypothetical protein
VTPSSAITLYGVGVAAHVIAVIAAFGALFAYPWLPAGTASAHHSRERLLSVLVSRAGGLAFVIGLYLANERGYLGEVWVLVPLVIIVVVLGIVGAVLTPRERRLAAMADGDPLRPRIERQVVGAGLACAALVAVAAFFMVTKLG